MASDEPPASWRRFAALVPKSVKSEVRAELQQLEAARAPIEKKKKSARFKAGGHDDAAALKHDRYSHDKLRKPRKPTRTQRRAAFANRGKQMLRAMEAHLEKYKARLKALGQHDADPVGIKPHVHRIGQMLARDPTGRAHLVALCQMPRSLALATLKAATRIELGDELPSGAPSAKRFWKGPGRRALHHPACLRMIATMVLLWVSGTRTKRAGFDRVVHGISRPMILKLMTDSHGYAPSLGSVFGTSSAGMGASVPLLKAAGLLQANQPPGDEVDACDRGTSGYAFNVYWLRGAHRGWPEVESGIEQDVLALHVAASRKLAQTGQALRLAPD